MTRSNPNARSDLIPVGRFGTAEETADVAVMLAINGYITVQTINVKSKPKRRGAHIGVTRKWKKAVVELAPGNRIEFFGAA